MDGYSSALSRRVLHWTRQASWVAWMFCALSALGFYAPHAVAAELVSVSEKIPLQQADVRLHEQLSTLKDRSVLINFWATWCEPCREEMPSLQRLATRSEGKGLAVITVAVADNKKQAEDFLWEIGVTLPVIHDPAQGLSRPWHARVLPTTLILDRKHRIRLRGQGAIDWDNPVIDQQLQPLLK